VVAYAGPAQSDALKEFFQNRTRAWRDAKRGGTNTLLRNAGFNLAVTQLQSLLSAARFISANKTPTLARMEWFGQIGLLG
jgi:hypothetical protein